MSTLKDQAAANPDSAAGRNSRQPHYRRIVVKAGTNVLTGGDSSTGLDESVMAGLVNQISGLVNQDKVQVLLVTSGAIAAGRQTLAEYATVPAIPDIPARQVLAALGQGRLMNIYSDLFAAYGIPVAQALLTINDMAERQSYLNIRNTLLSLLELGVVPVLNENDVVASDEIGEVFGDNDRLSALLATLIDADMLIILSDVDGLYTADPKLDPTAKLVPMVDLVDERVSSMAGEHRNAWARGGMPTKLDAARLVTSSGIAMTICRGRDPDVIARAVCGEPVGTFFRPASSKLEARKRWMLSRVADGDWGEVVVDDGAVTALRNNGVSLLPAGVRTVSGEFKRGDNVYVVGSSGQRVACGIANYTSTDIRRISGLQSNRITDTLGYQYGEEIIHRNNLVLL